jgi:hypothetical protein
MTMKRLGILAAVFLVAFPASAETDETQTLKGQALVGALFLSVKTPLAVKQNLSLIGTKFNHDGNDYPDMKLERIKCYDQTDAPHWGKKKKLAKGEADCILNLSASNEDGDMHRVEIPVQAKFSKKGFEILTAEANENVE